MRIFDRRAIGGILGWSNGDGAPGASSYSIGCKVQIETVAHAKGHVATSCIGTEWVRVLFGKVIAAGFLSVEQGSNRLA